MGDVILFVAIYFVLLAAVAFGAAIGGGSLEDVSRWIERF